MTAPNLCAGPELNFNDPPGAYRSEQGKPGGLQISSASPENRHENPLIESQWRSPALQVPSKIETYRNIETE